MQPNKYVAFTDGSSRGNPGPGGWGVVLITPASENVSREAQVTELGGREVNTTNNRMELRAAVAALESVPTPEQLIIYTDSAYLTNNIAHAPSWKEKGWMTSTKKPVLNQDLWDTLLEGGIEKVQVIRIPGHASVAGNERADAIATTFADGKNIHFKTVPLTEYGKDILDISSSPEGLHKKKRKGGTAYSYVSAVNGKIEVHKTWPECERRVKGVSGARFQKALSREEEEELIRMFSK